MEWDRLSLGIEQHAFICGLTGSGKSKLGEFIINDRRKRYSVVYDPKHSRTIGEWEGQAIIYSWTELIESKEQRIIYRPSKQVYERDGKLMTEATDPGRQNDFFEFIFTRERTRVLVDECAALLGDSRPNFWLKHCLTQGREKGVSVVCLTQRPVSIPLITMSEASRFYIFRLNLDEDRERMAKITGISVQDQKSLHGHQFFFFDIAHGAYVCPSTGSPRKIELDLSGLRPRPLFGVSGGYSEEHTHGRSSIATLSRKYA